jgi:hypothetical protein
MGYVTLGMAVMQLASKSDPRYYAYGVNGAMFMMIAHGITSTGMFFLVGVIYDRAHTRDLRKLGGLLNAMPIYGAVTMLIFFGSMGLPGLCGFIAEVFVILSSFNYNPLLGIFAAAAVVLTAGYILWTLQRVLLGRNEQYRGLPDLTIREMIIAAPLVILTVALGVAPQQTLLSWMSPSVDQMVRTVTSAGRSRAPSRPPNRPPQRFPRKSPRHDRRPVDEQPGTCRAGDGIGHGDRPGGGLAVRRAGVRRHGELLAVEGRGRGDRGRRPPARGASPGRGRQRRRRRGRPRDGRTIGTRAGRARRAGQ